jgi:hypothetical protein
MDNIDLIVKNVKTLMELKGIDNPTQLSDRMTEAGYPYSQPNLSRLLGKKYKNIEIGSLVLLAKYFKVTVGQIIGTEPLSKNKWLTTDDEFKRQIDETYSQLTPANRDALAIHANLLLTAQSNQVKSAANPYPAKLPKKESTKQ